MRATTDGPADATSREPRRRVVLFDLDGTVLTFTGTPPSPGRAALNQAMEKICGVRDACRDMRFAGGTDRGLIRALLRRAERTEDEATIVSVLDAYVVELEAFLRAKRYVTIGDVTGTVEALRAHGAMVGVATGNLRVGAELKLASAGLAGTFDLERGGYGCDAELRADIVRAAIERCLAGYAEPSAATVVVIGDTQNDVLAARAVGARVVGVAATPTARTELEIAGADVIVSACGPELVTAVRAI